MSFTSLQTQCAIRGDEIMFGMKNAIAIGLTVGFGVTAALTGAARAEQLITAAEAALPAPPELGLTLRGITRGPAIDQIEPSPDAKDVASPMSLKIGFSARNNATIDPGSVKVTYIKSPSVDLTERMKAYVTPDGIDMKKAELPPGNHVIRIDLKDSQGRTATSTIKLSVKK